MSDFGSLLRDEVLADEPAFLMSSLPSTTQGARVVRRRRAALLAALPLAVVGAALLVPALTGIASRPGPPEGPVAVAPERPSATPSPGGFLDDPRPPADLRPASGAWEAFDDPSEGAVRIRWYRVSPDDLVRVASWSRSPSTVDLCDGAANQVSCETAEGAAGETVVTGVYHVARHGRAFEPVAAQDAPGSWWFERRVDVVAADRSVRSAAEFVYRTELPKAEAAWVHDPADLASLARTRG